MARNNWSLTSGQGTVLALVAGTLKTVIQFVSPAATALEIIQQLLVTFDGTSNTATPIIIELLRQSAASTGGSTAATRVKIKDTSTALIADSANTVVFAGAVTTEGTVSAVIAQWHIHPQAGVIYPLPLPDSEVEIPGSGIIAIKMNAPANVNTLVTLFGEE